MTRFGWVMTTYFAAPSIGLSALFHPAPTLLWNASASVPIGLYAVHRAGALHLGELLVVTPPEPLASFLDQRYYLPKGVPLDMWPSKRVIREAGARQRELEHCYSDRFPNLSLEHNETGREEEFMSLTILCVQRLR